MPRFRKKPVVIDAVRFEGFDEAGNPIFLTGLTGWLTDARKAGTVNWAERTLTIATLEGVHTASPGDWIIRGVKGEIYPCKPDIFALTYDAE